ncbi:hypothetical protein ACT7C9_30875 [Bacillus cereus]
MQRQKYTFSPFTKRNSVISHTTVGTFFLPGLKDRSSTFGNV